MPHSVSNSSQVNGFPRDQHTGDLGNGVTHGILNKVSHGADNRNEHHHIVSHGADNRNEHHNTVSHGADNRNEHHNIVSHGADNRNEHHHIVSHGADNRNEHHHIVSPNISPGTGRPRLSCIDLPFTFPELRLAVIDEVSEGAGTNAAGPPPSLVCPQDKMTVALLTRTPPRFDANYWTKEANVRTNSLWAFWPYLTFNMDNQGFTYPRVEETREDKDGEESTEREKSEDEQMENMSKVLADASRRRRGMPGRESLVRQHLVHVENRLFEMFGDKDKNTINISKFLMGLTATGMRHTDPRLKEMRENLKKFQQRIAESDLQALNVSYDTFMSIISDNLEVVVKALSSSFVIPDFRGFCHHIEDIYATCLANTNGTVAQYIPQLVRSNPNHWAVSICTVDGQRYSTGDTNVPFTLQSCSKPLTYALASTMYGTEHMHTFIGMEPSGRYFNELCLDYNNKPHNPMINAGAIMTAALLKPDLSAADRFDYVFNMYKRLAGDEYLGFNNAVFLSEKECADRNFALAYFMRENKCFPEGTRLHETLDFYFQLCSLEITAESGAVMAATLANGGINPLTGDPVLTVDAVRNTLTLMHSCGMYNYSGQFAFKVGLPSKSGVSGCVLLVVPNTMGICLWSPPLDTNGNSCRAVQFCMELVSRFNFHNFDNLRGHFTSKCDPRMAKAESKAQILFDLLFSAAAGDLSALRRHSLSGTDMQTKDYDGRTALHVATSEGHLEIVKYLLHNCQVYPLPKDRWGRTPLDDASSFGHPDCGDMITESCRKRGVEIPPLLTDKEFNAD
ncbi:glutaminase liver isoform, mitochondrial isoform X1 [Procambarus clarkii]|uniref:glutaminase liver isoform, mitochondrial isoform X1 n=1 Tax=Procambarus clarkii TaxID=6728 RepID=UPI0037423A20